MTPRGPAKMDAIGGSSFRRSWSLLRAGGRLVAFGISEGGGGERREIGKALKMFATTPIFHALLMMRDSKSVIGLNMLTIWDSKGNLDEYLDPLQFKAGSVVGCPGIVNAARAGNVTIANAVGNGVADDKLLYTFVPDLVLAVGGEVLADRKRLASKRRLVALERMVFDELRVRGNFVARFEHEQEEAKRSWQDSLRSASDAAHAAQDAARSAQASSAAGERRWATRW